MPKVTKNLRDGELVVKDGTTPTANDITVALDEGDLGIDETLNTVNVLDRGSLDHMRQGDEEPVRVTFTLKFVEYLKQSGDSDPSVYEVLTQQGGAAAWASTNDDGGDVFTLTLEFTIASPTSGDQDETITLTKFHPTSISFKEGDEYNTLGVEGEAFITRPSVAKV